jgi:hypothetical protein
MGEPEKIISPEEKPPPSTARLADPGAFVAEALTKAMILDNDTARAYGGLFSRFMRQQSRKATLDWYGASSGIVNIKLRVQTLL